MDAATKLRQCLELVDLGFEMHKQNLRRRHPDWSEEDVASGFQDWLAERPMDFPGEVTGTSSK